MGRGRGGVGGGGKEEGDGDGDGKAYVPYTAYTIHRIHIYPH